MSFYFINNIIQDIVPNKQVIFQLDDRFWCRIQHEQMFNGLSVFFIKIEAEDDNNVSKLFNGPICYLEYNLDQRAGAFGRLGQTREALINNLKNLIEKSFTKCGLSVKDSTEIMAKLELTVFKGIENA